MASPSPTKLAVLVVSASHPVSVNTEDRDILTNDIHPSFQHPVTRYASASSELPTSPASAPRSTHQSLPTVVSRSSSSLDSPRPRGYSTTSQSSVKRKPLPSSASPLATRYSSPDSLGASITTTVDLPFTRSFSTDSPTLYDNPLTPLDFGFGSQPPLPDERERKFSEQPDSHALTSSTLVHAIPHTGVSKTPNFEPPRLTQATYSVLHPSTVSGQNANAVNHSSLSAASNSSSIRNEDHSSSQSRTAAMSLFNTKPPTNLIITPDASQTSDETHTINIKNNTNTSNKALPKSPGASKLGSFFGWGGNTSPAGNISPSSSTTSFSIEDRAYSPIPSPSSAPPTPLKTASPATGRTIPAGIDVPKANSNDAGYFRDAYLQIPPVTPSVTQVDEMEDELKTITAELATSIRREMELEDLVERMQTEAQPSQAGKRTSDYFSDSGTSSVKFGSEHEVRAEELDRLQRKTEREKAQIRLELTEKVNDERSRRKALESQIRNLEEKASQFDLHAMNNVDSNDRLRELEASCEDLRRRLAEERQVKENFEDLLTALKSELEHSHNERDNLKDEIVPQLRARVEGLEAQAAEHEKLTYENTKMQQEMQILKNENATLINARKMQMDMQQQATRFNGKAEDGSASLGLSRSNTLSGVRNGSRPLSISKSNSTQNNESREVLVERVKDIEAQRDALHRALKSLLERQEHQNRTHDSRIKQLEMERDRALTAAPERLIYDKEVARLRDEINILRRRADEAIEQKWQCEKGLGGLRMDLQRAEQEISSLRGMLAESTSRSPGAKHARTNSVTSDALERAYSDLKSQYASSLERIKRLEIGSDANTEAAIQDLEKSLSRAIIERDHAVGEAETVRQANASLHGAEKAHLESEQALAEELRSSAKRVEELAAQVRQQLTSNATLRKRLAETIDRGEKEQKGNAARIVFMQGKLKSLEDDLIVAQQNSEERITRHEEEISGLRDAHNSQLSRVRDGFKSPRVFSPKSPLSPLFSAKNAKYPRLSRTTGGPGISVSEDSKTEFLKKRVEDLERALEDADKEMEEVVSRMNSAQIEVMELWNEREEAVRVTRRLEKEVEEERKRGIEGRLKTLQS